MKTIFIILFITAFTSSFANDNKVCQKCHPIIYKEYYNSIHRHSSLVNDKIYKAVFNKEFKESKKNRCSKCHSPSAKTPKRAKQAPITCIYCHTIKNIKEGKESNKNILSGKKRDFYTAQLDKKNESKVKYGIMSSFFGLIKRSKNSPYHQIEYNNENYYTGNVCMGCHSHVNNVHNFDVIMLDAYIDKKDKHTCISCHMPQVMGSKTTLRDSKTHAFHGILGVHLYGEQLGKYINFKINQKATGFNVKIINQANHALFGEAYREGILKVTILRAGKIITLKSYIFTRIFGKNGVQSLPFEAKGILKDTLIYGKKIIHYNTKLKKGDKITLTLGFKLISNKSAKELNLQNDKELTRFQILKVKSFKN